MNRIYFVFVILAFGMVFSSYRKGACQEHLKNIFHKEKVQKMQQIKEAIQKNSYEKAFNKADQLLNDKKTPPIIQFYSRYLKGIAAEYLGKYHVAKEMYLEGYQENKFVDMDNTLSDEAFSRVADDFPNKDKDQTLSDEVDVIKTGSICFSFTANQTKINNIRPDRVKLINRKTGKKYKPLLKSGSNYYHYRLPFGTYHVKIDESMVLHDLTANFGYKPESIVRLSEKYNVRRKTWRVKVPYLHYPGGSKNAISREDFRLVFSIPRTKSGDFKDKKKYFPLYVTISDKQNIYLNKKYTYKQIRKSYVTDRGLVQIDLNKDVENVIDKLETSKEYGLSVNFNPPMRDEEVPEDPKKVREKLISISHTIILKEK